MNNIDWSNKLLTIAIPTYNRSHYLEACLNSICPQLTDAVAVVVRDNKSSNYDFWDFIKPYQEKFDVVAYQNEVNIGGDANFARLFELCETRWLWIMGDDDIINDNAVNMVLTNIMGNQDMIFVKFNSPYEGITIGLEGFAEAMKPRLAFGYSFFISEGIHNVELTKQQMYWHYKTLSTSCAQILRVMKHLVDNKEAKCLFIRDEIIKNHGADITWTHYSLIPTQVLIYDFFYEQRKILKDNVFKDIAMYLMNYVYESEIPFCRKMHYYGLIAYKYGILNILHYNYPTCLRILLKMILSKESYKKIKSIIKK